MGAYRSLIRNKIGAQSYALFGQLSRQFFLKKRVLTKEWLCSFDKSKRIVEKT